MESMNNKNIFFLILNNIIKSKSATKMNWFDMKNILWTDFTRILFWGKKKLNAISLKKYSFICWENPLKRIGPCKFI